MSSHPGPDAQVMKGIWISQFNEPYVYRTDIPKSTLDRQPNMIVQIKAAGFCHTELMVLARDFGGTPGFVPGARDLRRGRQGGI